jgi:site-specific DNA recombinase
MNAEYLDRLRAFTHNGMLRRAERGLAAGGPPYGYRTVEGAGGRRIIIHEQESDVVRELFRMFLEGESLRAITHRLNGEAVPPPRPRAMHGRPPSWSVTALRSMLMNPVYRGEYVWNRSEWVKDHETGRRRRHERPESEWLRRESPELAIVDRDAWQQAQEELKRRANRFGRARDGTFRSSARGHPVRAKHLLSGFLECGICGGGFFRAWSNRFYACFWHRDRGPMVCSNDLRIAQHELETRFLRGMQEQILVPDLVLYAVEKALDLAHVRTAEPRTSGDRGRLAEVETEIEHLVRLAARLGHLDAHERVLGELERERDQLRARLRQSTPEFDLEALRDPIDKTLRDLGAWLMGTAEQGRAALRALLGERRLQVRPDSEQGFRIDGELELALEIRTARGPEDLEAVRFGGSGGAL